MEVSLTEDHLEWQKAIARLADSYPVTSADLIPTTDLVAGWREVAEVGIPGLRSPGHSGVEQSGVECAIAVEQAGRRLSPLPILGQGVIAPDLLVAAGAETAMDQVVDGRLRLAPGLNPDLADFAQLGQPAVAFDAAGASHALVLGGSGSRTSLLAVAIERPGADGLDITRVVAPVHADSAPLSVDLGGYLALDRLDRTRALMMCMLAADLVGVMEEAVVDAVQYAKDRQQFGVPIGSFQAVQHILADAVVALEGARSCVWHAAWALDRAPVFDALLSARVAKAYCSEAALRVVEATVQVFGGIAITWEHLSHVRLRRVHLDRECFGSEQVQYPEIGAMRLSRVS